MTLRQYLCIMGMATVLCWVAWWIVVANVDPFEAPWTGMVFFYISLFLALVGTCSMGMFSWHRMFSPKDLPMYRYVQKSFHGAVALSFCLIVLLYLQGERLLRIWNFLALISFIVVLWVFRHLEKKTETLPQLTDTYETH